MQAESSQHTGEASSPDRKPRIILLGEFSAGKSTLANLLMGKGMSPVKVTATQLPPIWYAHGENRAVRIDHAGARYDLPLDALDLATPADTKAIKVYLDAEVLEFCDLIDMPGTSDPNMSTEAWEEIVALADGAVWCTPSTQAWRQSEAALWEQMPVELHAFSLLLITRIDKLLTERDQKRVVARVRREVGGQFRDVFPISLTQAMAAGDDEDMLNACGAADFVDSLIGLVEEIAPALKPDEEGSWFAPETQSAEPDVAPEDAPENRKPELHLVHDQPEAEGSGNIFAVDFAGEADDDDMPDAISPRRVVRDEARRARTRPIAPVGPVIS